jgi:uncharacterized membrane protein
MAETGLELQQDLPATHPAKPARAHSRTFSLLVISAFVAVVATWLFLTPDGVLGKADAVGYAICHRIERRSFHIHDRQLPLCARDTGIYLGVIVGFVVVGAAGRWRAGRMPPTPILAVLVSFIFIMAVDGLNSYSHLFENTPRLYTPHNWLRLVTGTFHGLALSSLVYPVVNMTLWRDVERRPTIENFKELGGLMLICGVIIGLVLLENPLILYPLAILSVLGVLMMLTAINTMVTVILMRRENTYTRWREVVIPILIGLTFALVELGLIDAARYAMTGTWAGFDL